MIEKDGIKVTSTVAVDPETAFRVFTEETDAWWRRGPAFRGVLSDGGVMRFEPGPGGRLVEVGPGGGEFEIGRILAWEPGRRLLFEWRNRNFTKGEVTQVEVRFEELADGTRVVLEHRGWSTLAEDHPARHGREGLAFARMIGGWWGDLLASLRHHAAE